MEEDKIVEPTEKVEPTEAEEPATTPEEPEVPEADEESKLEAKNRQLFERAKKAEAEARAAKAEAEALKKTPSSLDVEDYIDISASLEGLDQREKQYLAEQHKLTGKSLSKLRENEDFVLWQSAYRQKMEKEKALSPTATQPEVDQPRSVADLLKNAKTLQEKEDILKKIGGYKDPHPQRNDRVVLGPQL